MINKHLKYCVKHVFRMLLKKTSADMLCVTSEILLEVMFSTYHKSNRLIATCCQG